MGWGAIICASVCLLLIPCTSYNTETALIWVGRGVASAFFQSMFVYTSELYPVRVKVSLSCLSCIGFCDAISDI